MAGNQRLASEASGPQLAAAAARVMASKDRIAQLSSEVASGAKEAEGLRKLHEALELLPVHYVMNALQPWQGGGSSSMRASTSSAGAAAGRGQCSSCQPDQSIARNHFPAPPPSASGCCASHPAGGSCNVTSAGTGRVESGDVQSSDEDDEDVFLMDETENGEANALVYLGVTYELCQCVHMCAGECGDSSKNMVGRIDQIRRWREEDAVEKPEMFEVGEIVILVTWFYRAHDTNNPKATSDPREVFLTTNQDYNRPASICCACVVTYVPFDDVLGLKACQAEQCAADEAIQVVASGGAARCGGSRSQLEPCSGNGDTPPCTMRHYYFRRWYDPDSRSFTTMSPQQGANEEGAMVARTKQTAQRIHCLNISVEAKLRALLDHVAALKVNKAFRHVNMERRLPITVKRTDIVGCVLRAFTAIKGPSLFRQTDVKFYCESGIDRGGLTSEMLADFFDNLIPTPGTTSEGSAPPLPMPLTSVDGPDMSMAPFRVGASSGQASEAQAHFEAERAFRYFETSGGEHATYWLPRAGLHAERAERLVQLHAVGKVLAKCLLELHAVPPAFPPVLFAALAYGGDETTLIRDIIPTGGACTCALGGRANASFSGTEEPKPDSDRCQVHSALDLLRHFDPDAAASLSNMLEQDIDPSLGLTCGDLLGEAPPLQPSPAECGLQLAHAADLDSPEADADSEDERAGKAAPRTDGAPEGKSAKGAKGSKSGTGGEAGKETVCKEVASVLDEESPGRRAAAQSMAAAPLTNANKASCVIRVVSYKLLECRLPEIVAIRRGFHTIKWASHVSLFTGDELQELMCGVASLGAADLWDCISFDERTCQDRRQWLRATFYEQSMTWRKKFLRFITGSFTLPRGGLQRKISVRSLGEGSRDQLPRASTCTYTLFMPPYNSKEELTSKVTTAIDNTAGFWLW